MKMKHSLTLCCPACMLYKITNRNLTKTYFATVALASYGAYSRCSITWTIHPSIIYLSKTSKHIKRAN